MLTEEVVVLVDVLHIVLTEEVVVFSVLGVVVIVWVGFDMVW